MTNNNGGLDPKSYQQAISAVEELNKRHKSLNKTLEGFKSAWNGISTTIFGISGADWWDKVPKTTDEIAREAELLREMENNLKGIGKTLDASVNDSLKRMGIGIEGLQENLEGFSNSYKGKIDIIADVLKDAAGNFTFDEANEMLDLIQKKSADFSSLTFDDREKLNKLIDKSKIDEKDIAKTLEESQKKSEVFYQKLLKDLPEINDIEDEGLKKKFLLALANGKISNFLDEHQEKGIAILSIQKQIYNDISDQVAEYMDVNKQTKEITKELSKTEREAFSISKGILSIGKNIVSGVIPKLLEFDKVIHDVQKSSGIMLTENAASMTNLSMKTAAFGMNIQQTTEFMSALADELKTVELGVLEKAADDLNAVQLATGISSENLTNMAGEMMRNGDSSERVAEAMSEANVYAKRFGVSSKKVLEGMSKNITKMRTMGFQGGEKSLMKMVATAERLRMNVDEIFDVASKARSIEGAMQMAAELQLAGGSFANINPMDLLSSARKGPEELQKILTKMGTDIGNFDKETGKMSFDPVDKDRLQIVADATEQTLDSIQKMIEKNAQDNAKMQYMPDISFKGITDEDGKPIDPDQIKNTLLDAVNLTGTALKGSVLDEAGINNLRSITQEQVQAIMKDQIKKDKNLEEQARQNQGFSDALTALKDSFINMITIFEPVIEALTAVIQWIIKNKWALFIGAIVMLAAYMPTLIASMGGMIGSLKGWLTGFTGMFKKGGITEMFKGGMMKKGGNPLGGATNVANSSNQVKPTAGMGLVAFAKNLGVVFKTAAKYDLKGIAKFALAITSLLIPLTGMALIFGALGGDPLILVAMAASLVGLAFALKIISKVEMNMKNIIMFSLGMLIVGAALIPFAYAARMMSEVDWGGVLIGIVILTAVVIGLMLLGAMMTGPQLLGLIIGIAILVAVALSLMVVGASFMVLAAGLNALATVDWSSFSGIGPALAQVAGGLALFALAGLMFVNPITLIGMLLMIGTLIAISLVLVPLSEALEMGGKGMDTMASGILKLTDSLSKLDFEKLEQLKEFSKSMAIASLAGGAMSSMVSVIEAIGKLTGNGNNKNGSGAGTDSKPIIIQLKMPSGAVIEECIIKDIDRKT